MCKGEGPGTGKRLRAETRVHRKAEQARDKSTSRAGSTPGGKGTEGARRPRGLGSRSREAARGQHERLCRALRFHIFRVILECSLGYSTARTKLRLRAVDLLRERKTVNVSWWVAHGRSKQSGCR